MILSIPTYIKGKSVRTALFSLVSHIWYALEYKESSLVAFLNINDVFNNVNQKAITNALKRLYIQHSLKLTLLSGRNLRHGS